MSSGGRRPLRASRHAASPSDREVIIELNRRGGGGQGEATVEPEGQEEDMAVVRGLAEETRAASRERLDAFLSSSLIESSGTGGEEGGEVLDVNQPSTAEDASMAEFVRGLRAQLDSFEVAMGRRICGREREIRLLLLSLFSQQHALLLGPSGIGKSMLSDCVLDALDPEGGDVYTFRRQLNRFTTPEELFGPLSVRGLQRDVHLRLTESYLPGATLAFLDEAFKASSSILNSLLTILNERTFCEDGSCELPSQVPLLMCVFSSNEIPPENDTSVRALFDRILIRLPMKPLQGEELVAMLGSMHRGGPGGEPSSPEAFLRRGDILRIKEYSQERVEVPEAVIDLLRKLRIHLRDALDVNLSDRRLLQTVQVLRVCACLNGRR